MIMTNEKIRGAAFHHIALKAVDFDKSLAFYKALGAIDDTPDALH